MIKLSTIGGLLWFNNKASSSSAICMWQILQSRFPTKVRLAKWGITYGVRRVLCHLEVEDKDHNFHGCHYIQEVYHYICYHILFHWASSFENEVHLMTKLCKRKFSKASVSVMVWTEMLYQTRLQRIAKIFEGKVLLAWCVAKTVIFYVAFRLKDDRKASLMYTLTLLFLFVWSFLLAILLSLKSLFHVQGDGFSFHSIVVKRFFRFNIFLLIVKKNFFLS